MGRVVGAFGVAGWVKVKVFTESAHTLGTFPKWWLQSPAGWREVEVEDFEVHSKGPVAKLAGCDDRNAADAMRGTEVAVTREALGEAEEGTFYWVDLVGLEVVDAQGTRLGEVEGLFETGETSVLVVKGAKERLIPFIPDYVKTVDREARRITVDWKPDYDA
ncbi:MAG TPA: ribosome maturation factor RimM [Usitatibacter sp.]|nr:ribosome maturation factor RimM [Usitatibacter sp.]